MLSRRSLLGVLVLMPYFAQGQSTDTAVAVYAVAYVETRAAADAGHAALKAYRAAAERQPGCAAVEVFAQAGRPGRFAVLETWRDQAALDARGPGPKQQLMAALQSSRVSGYDERPYKPLTRQQAKARRRAASLRHRPCRRRAQHAGA